MDVFNDGAAMMSMLRAVRECHLLGVHLALQARVAAGMAVFQPKTIRFCSRVENDDDGRLSINPSAVLNVVRVEAAGSAYAESHAEQSG